VRNLIADKLACLASLPIQQRYIEHATSDEYLLAEEVLEDAFDAVRMSTIIAKDLNVDTMDALAELGRLLRHAEPDFASPEFITSDPTWCALREAAKRCLVALGFDLESWELEELSPKRDS
jgi:hypothetical protein